MRVETVLKWSDSNTKVQKLGDRFGKVFSFGLPAFKSEDGFKVCPGAGACAAVCFARQGQYVRSAVKNAREVNLRAARGNLQVFIKHAVSDLKRLGAKLVRIHDSGDFFSSSYLNAWFSIARSLPGVKFYAYTKSIHLDLYTNKPENLAITQSFGGINDAEIDESRAVSRIFSTDYARRKAGFSDGSKTDLLAVKGEEGIKIGLIYHGVANLSDAQDKHFR